MPEYIEREAAISRLLDCHLVGQMILPSEALKRLADTPVADVEPVRHGKWEYDPDAIDFNLGGWVCSLCGARNNNIGGWPGISPLMFSGSKYCPNCGAKMQGKEREDRRE